MFLGFERFLFLYAPEVHSKWIVKNLPIFVVTIVCSMNKWSVDQVSLNIMGKIGTVKLSYQLDCRFI